MHRIEVCFWCTLLQPVAVLLKGFSSGGRREENEDEGRENWLTYQWTVQAE